MFEIVALKQQVLDRIQGEYRMSYMLKVYRIFYRSQTSVGVIEIPALSEYKAKWHFHKTHPGFEIMEIWIG